MPSDILLHQDYAHSREAVWRLITDSDAIARWLMPNDFRAEIGKEFIMRTKPMPGFDGVIRGRVMALDPPKLMQWAWNSGAMSSTVTFELAPIRIGTRLTLHQTGFRGAKGILPWLVLRHGWKRKLTRSIAELLDGR